MTVVLGGSRGHIDPPMRCRSVIDSMEFNLHLLLMPKPHPVEFPLFEVIPGPQIPIAPLDTTWIRKMMFPDSQP